MLIHFTFNMDDGYLRYELNTNKNEKKTDYTIDIIPNLPFSIEGYNELYVAYDQ